MCQSGMSYRIKYELPDFTDFYDLLRDCMYFNCLETGIFYFKYLILSPSYTRTKF